VLGKNARAVLVGGEDAVPKLVYMVSGSMYA